MVEVEGENEGNREWEGREGMVGGWTPRTRTDKVQKITCHSRCVLKAKRESFSGDA
jgi:hypothetical protein